MKVRFAVIMLCGGALYALPSFAQNVCESMAPDSATSFCYLKAVIRSLYNAHRTAIKPDINVRGQSVLDGATEVLYVAQRQQQGVREASSVISPFQSNRDTNVVQSAQLLVLAYGLMDSISSISQRNMRDHLDHKLSDGIGSQAEVLASLRLKRHDAAEAMIASIGAATSSFLVYGTDSRVVGLNLTKGEQGDLLRQIKGSFGPALKPKKGQYASDYAVAAHVLQDFLADKRWQLRKGR